MRSFLTKDMGTDINNRRVFNEHAKVYDKIRPHYPEQLFSALVIKSGLPSHARLLEIGPGSGQATISLAKKGYSILAIELGANLANLAKKRLSAYPNVQIVIDSFEDAELESESFDLIYAATAFHWIKPEFRFKKTHKLLKPGGYLAIIQTNHVSDNKGDIFFKATQPIYDKYMPNKEGKANTLPKVKDLRPVIGINRGLFKQTSFECFPLIVGYNAKDYIELISTYSPILALPPKKKRRLLKDIEQLIETKFNNRITKHYSMSLTLAQKI